MRPHSKTDTIEMAEAAIREIEQLRAERDRLAPRAEAYDTLRQVLSLLPQQSRGAGLDTLWQLKARVEELKSDDAPAGED